MNIKNILGVVAIAASIVTGICNIVGNGVELIEQINK